MLRSEIEQQTENCGDSMRHGWKIFCACLIGSSLGHGKNAQVVQSPIFKMAGARAAGMGSAFSSVEGDIDAVSFNPAGTVKIKQPWIAASYRRGVVDDNMGYVHYAH